MSRLGDDVSQAFREYVRLIAEKEALEAENAALRAELDALKPKVEDYPGTVSPVEKVPLSVDQLKQIEEAVKQEQVDVQEWHGRTKLGRCIVCGGPCEDVDFWFCGNSCRNALRKYGERVIKFPRTEDKPMPKFEEKP